MDRQLVDRAIMSYDAWISDRPVGPARRHNVRARACEKLIDTDTSDV